MKKITVLFAIVFLASRLSAQVQLSKNVQIGASVNQAQNSTGQCFLGIVGLVGALTDGSGVMKQPLCIGNGPTSFIVPTGATQLLLGVNDGQYVDNTGSFTISVSVSGAASTNHTVLGTAMPWDTTTNPSYDYGHHDGTAATVVATGLSAGDTVTITYVSGTVSADPPAYPLVDANGWLTNPPGPAGTGGPTGNALYGGVYTPTKYLTTAALSGSGTTTNALTANSSGGAAPGDTFNGSAAKTWDYHTFGALPVNNPTPTGALDGSGLTTEKLPVSAGCLATADGTICYDSTNKNWHLWVNGADTLVIPLAAGFVSGHCGQPTNTGGSWSIVDVGGACGVSGGGSSFSAITSGTNTSAAMLVGSGASLGPTGTGTINATAIGGITITGTPSAGQVPTATSSSTATWQASSAGTLPFVTPQSYGALGDGKIFFDGNITAAPTSTGTTGSSTTPAAPSKTTVVNNSIVINYFVTTKTWSAAPVAGTNILNLPFTTGLEGLYANATLEATPATAPSSSGTTSSSGEWIAFSFGIQPTPGNSIGSPNVATGTATAGNSNIVINKPTGTANGDLLIACFGTFSETMNTLAGWTALSGTSFAVSGSTTKSACFSKTASSEPSSYTFTKSAATNGAAGSIIDYPNATLPTSTLTSATASFIAGDANKLICTQNTLTSTTQQCGTIASYNSSTSITLSYASGVGAVSGDQFAYASNDSTAFANMFTGCAPVGCQIALGPYKYGLNTSLTWPNNVPLLMSGVGYGVMNTQNSIANSDITNNSNGTQLMFLTTSLSSAALTIGDTTHMSTTAGVKLADFTIYCGTGRSRDGCGADGLDIFNWQGADVGIAVFNAANYGIYIDAKAGPPVAYIEQVNLVKSYVSYSGGNCGVRIGGNPAVGNISDVTIERSIIESNNHAGLCLDAPIGDGFTLRDSTVQWDNVASAGPEIKVNGQFIGLITGNASENGSTGQSNAFINTATGNNGLWADHNSIGSPLVGSHMTFSAAGVALSTCNTSFNTYKQTACVSDATACTNGTTYTSGGSTVCKVQCTGTAWVETGSSDSCN